MPRGRIWARVANQYPRKRDPFKCRLQMIAYGISTSICAIFLALLLTYMNTTEETRPEVLSKMFSSINPPMYLGFTLVLLSLCLVQTYRLGCVDFDDVYEVQRFYMQIVTMRINAVSVVVTTVVAIFLLLDAYRLFFESEKN